ncbi:MAG: hypothetical protein NTW87_16895 [Planctomycetota bacterium]|nr:hypothetical protein [Planctomycetota bacterium]
MITRITVSAAALCFVLSTSSAAEAENKERGAASQEDWAAVEHCLDIIRQCQMNDGMIRIKGAGDAVWTVPYVSNFAAMALLAANGVRRHPQDVQRVERWLLWYAANQEADGTICDQEGTVAAYKSNGRKDSTDAYAATFLMAAWRYSQARGEKPRSEIVDAARKALSAIEAVAQEDGLTIAKPGWPMKYLMDNVEVHGGLHEGALFFDAVDSKKEAKNARRLAARIAVGLGRFWSEERQYYEVALDTKGVYSGGFKKSYPDGLAQLFALAHIAPPRPELWARVRKTFKPGDEGVPVERWLMAATRCAGAEETGKLREATRQAMLHFTAEGVYVDRPALAILALIDGRARFPDVPAASSK